jgi:hypothetical protein
MNGSFFLLYFVQTSLLENLMQKKISLAGLALAGTLLLSACGDEVTRTQNDSVRSTGDLTVSLRDIVSGSVAPGATVTLLGTSQAQVANAAGVVVYKDLPAGSYSFRVSAAGYAPMVCKADILMAMDMSDIPIAKDATVSPSLYPLGTSLQGYSTYTDSLGNPKKAAGAIINARLVAPSGCDFENAVRIDTVAADGSWKLDSLPALADLKLYPAAYTVGSNSYTTDTSTVLLGLVGDVTIQEKNIAYELSDPTLFTYTNNWSNGIATTDSLKLAFTMPVNLALLPRGTISVTKAGVTVPTNLAWNITGDTLTISPALPWAAGDYLIRGLRASKAMNGKSLASQPVPDTSFAVKALGALATQPVPSLFYTMRKSVNTYDTIAFAGKISYDSVNTVYNESYGKVNGLKWTPVANTSRYYLYRQYNSSNPNYPNFLKIDSTTALLSVVSNIWNSGNDFGTGGDATTKYMVEARNSENSAYSAELPLVLDTVGFTATPTAITEANMYDRCAGAYDDVCAPTKNSDLKANGYVSSSSSGYNYAFYWRTNTIGTKTFTIPFDAKALTQDIVKAYAYSNGKVSASVEIGADKRSVNVTLATTAAVEASEDITVNITDGQGLVRPLYGRYDYADAALSDFIATPSAIVTEADLAARCYGAYGTTSSNYCDLAYSDKDILAGGYLGKDEKFAFYMRTNNGETRTFTIPFGALTIGKVTPASSYNGVTMALSGENHSVAVTIDAAKAISGVIEFTLTDDKGRVSQPIQGYYYSSTYQGFNITPAAITGANIADRCSGAGSLCNPSNTSTNQANGYLSSDYAFYMQTLVPESQKFTIPFRELTIDTVIASSDNPSVAVTAVVGADEQSVEVTLVTTAATSGDASIELYITNDKGQVSIPVWGYYREQSYQNFTATPAAITTQTDLDKRCYGAYGNGDYCNLSSSYDDDNHNGYVYNSYAFSMQTTATATQTFTIPFREGLTVESVEVSSKPNGVGVTAVVGTDKKSVVVTVTTTPTSTGGVIGLVITNDRGQRSAILNGYYNMAPYAGFTATPTEIITDADMSQRCFESVASYCRLSWNSSLNTQGYVYNSPSTFYFSNPDHSADKKLTVPFRSLTIEKVAVTSGGCSIGDISYVTMAPSADKHSVDVTFKALPEGGSCSGSYVYYTITDEKCRVSASIRGYFDFEGPAPLSSGDTE